MATREAEKLAQEQAQRNMTERLERIEAKLDELLLILNPEVITDDSNATFGDKAEAETTDDGTHGGFMDTEVEIDVTPAKKSKSKTL